MSTTLIYVAAGTLLGILQFGLGIAAGMWIRRAARDRDNSSLDGQRLQELVSQVTSLTSGISEDVQGHQAKMSRINERLTVSHRAGHSSLADVVVGVVGEVLRANGELQHRLSAAEAQLQQQSMEIHSHLTQALTDELTGLPNRRAFDEQMRRRLEGHARHGVPFALLLIDIDHFKRVNDTYGHIAGDRVLCTIGEVLRASLRKPDTVARYGGEEFAALLPCSSLKDAVHAARHARVAVENTESVFEGAAICVTASVGVAAVQDGDDVTAILKRADDALYASKSGGRNCGHTYDGASFVRIPSDFAAAYGEDSRVLPAAVERDPFLSGGSPSVPSPELSTACAELRDYAALHSGPG